MKRYKFISLALIASSLFFHSCSMGDNKTGKPSVYQDAPFWQDYAVKYYSGPDVELKKALADRNEYVQLQGTDRKLYIPANGHFQYPGKIVSDVSYIPMNDRKISDVIIYKGQFVYLDDKAVFSNAHAGKLYLKHDMPDAKILCGGNNYDFLISDGKELCYIDEHGKNSVIPFKQEDIVDIEFSDSDNSFYILTGKSVYSLKAGGESPDVIYSGGKNTCFALTSGNDMVIGTTDGYLIIDTKGKVKQPIDNKLPRPVLTAVKELNGNLWFGSDMGAFMLRDDGKFNYYYGERWLPGNVVMSISNGPGRSVLITTDKGLGIIKFRKMTLEDKAMLFEKQVRQRHIRYGINASVTSLKDHDLSTNILRSADSDNLWTAMYMAAELFRYKVTGSDTARQNYIESFEALERMHTINNIPGLFGRTFERRGYQEFKKEYRGYVEDYWYPGYNNVVSWHHANDEWDWRGSASSDQTVGQVFAMTLIAEYCDDKEYKDRAVKILDDMMSYIVDNGFTLVDVDGKPTLWGRWNPEYINRFDTMIGDRKVYSSNIIAFLQSAYKHTGKVKYKEKAFELMTQYGYLENLIRPFSEIGHAPDSADNWSRMLSKEWNHSDDEMYFLSYWALYPYAFNDTLKEKYLAAIKDHWEWELPEKNPLWNFCYAMTGAHEFGLDDAIWTLKEWPLDMIQYEVKNSHRKDIEFVKKNFWGQITKEVLPPDERPELKYNRNLFKLDSPDRHSELSAGDTFLLPYWMGRFLGVISPPMWEIEH